MILGVALETKVRICSRSRESYDDISDDLLAISRACVSVDLLTSAT